MSGGLTSARRACIVVLLVAPMALCVGRPLHADPVLITSGFVSDAFTNERYTFAGDGFSAGGTFFVGNIAFQPTPRTDMDLSGTLSFLNYGSGGFLSVGGTTFSSPTPLAITGQFTYRAAPFFVPVPTLADSTFTFSTPFTGSGHFSSVTGLSVDFVGQGTASVSGSVFDFYGTAMYGGPEIGTLTFSAAAPTPEPAPWLLLGAGALAVLVRARAGGGGGWAQRLGNSRGPA